MRPLSRKRVVVTGMGMVSPAGLNVNENWNNILEGVRRVGRVKTFDVGDMPCQIAYEVEGFELPEDVAKRLDLSIANRFTQFGLSAAYEALLQADIKPFTSKNSELSIVMGSGMGSPTFSWFSEIYLDGKLQDDRVLESHGNRPERLAHYLKQMTGAQRSVKTVHTACASSGQSLGEAFEMIASGEESLILTGGADSMINPFHMAGFCLLGALSQRNEDPTTASRPFDENRNGFVLGEGAAMLVFEEYEHAQKRGANILGEVCGYGITESAYRITDLHPEGRGPTEAMQMAVENAGINPSDLGYVNAHGTSTLLNDRIESLAINKVFGDQVFVSSTKSVTGHMISAAGAIEFALTLLAIKNQILPPSINLFEKDAQCAINPTPSKPLQQKIRYGLSNSVGFGGSNTALIAGRMS